MRSISSTTRATLIIAAALATWTAVLAEPARKLPTLFPVWEEDDKGYGFIDANGKREQQHHHYSP